MLCAFLGTALFIYLSLGWAQKAQWLLIHGEYLTKVFINILDHIKSLHALKRVKRCSTYKSYSNNSPEKSFTV